MNPFTRKKKLSRETREDRRPPRKTKAKIEREDCEVRGKN
jgi:hypothetical protein